MDLIKTVRTEMIGRLGMTDAEAEVLAEVAAGSEVHLEIGTLWGGSAILAALAGARRVYSVDMMAGGWWGMGRDPMVEGERLCFEAVVENLRRFGLEDRVELVVARSDPFPLEGVRFDTALIDGDHGFEGVRPDWNNVHPLTNKTVLFHDCDAGHPGVWGFVNSGQVEDAGWVLLRTVDSLRVYGRTSDED